MNGGPLSSAANEVIGMVGGMTVSASLIPQVIKTAQTRSTEDISYAWQAAYIAGLAGINYYALSEGLWPVYIPGLVEMALISVLTIMKVSFESAACGTESYEDHGTTEPPATRTHSPVLRPSRGGHTPPVSILAACKAP